MGHVLGMNAKAYYDATPLSDGAATATWLELTNVRDVTLNLETGEADISARDNLGWRATAATLKDGSVEFEMRWDTADAGFAAIQAAWAAAGEIALAFLDGGEAVAGSQGLAGNFTITNFSRSEPLEEALMVSVTAKPSSHTEWYTVTT